ncbi:MAG TPA: DUF1579 family protein [Terracidiphilus sp.]|nr:DUF1579 family protein [Terracidiphilus sp.]
MRFFLCLMILLGGALADGQQPVAPPTGGLNNLAWMEGDWAGKQDFNTGGGPAMVGDATDEIRIGIEGKYLCEMLSTTLPGRKPTDTRHFISYDKESNQFNAWWFNDTSTHPMKLSGELSSGKLVLLSDPSAPGPELRATYESPSQGKLTFLLEMKTGESWRKLFLSTYMKKTPAEAQNEHP